VWAKTLADKSLAVGFFNRAKVPLSLQVPWASLGFTNAPQVRDLWLRQDLPKSETLTAEIPAHGCLLLKVN